MKNYFVLFLVFPLVAKAQTLPSIEDKTKNLTAYNGFLNFFWDDNAGKIWLQINKLDTELLYQTSLPSGLGSNDVGLDRGLLGQGAVVKFIKAGNKILMVQPNYSYRATSNNAAEKRAVEQSFAQSTLWGFTVEAKSNESVLVDATPFLMRDAMQVAIRLACIQPGKL